MTTQCPASINLFNQPDRCQLDLDHDGPHATTVWGPTVHWTAGNVWTSGKVAS